MGESTNPRATLRFDRRVRLKFHGATITSDAGLLACRELDDALGLTETAEECLQESRGDRNVQHRLVGLLRQSVYSRLAGYEDTNDAERLSDDPAMRVVVGRRGGPERPAASTNTMSRFETEVLTQDGNVEELGRVNATWVDRAMTHTAHRRVILDMDSSESPVHGGQEGASYNGHLGSMCYHPLFVFNQFGDCEGAMLRAGNVHSAHRWRDVLDPVLSRYGATGVRRYFRADAAFAKPADFTFESSPEGTRSGQTLTFNLVGDTSVSYTLTAPTTTETRSISGFSGTLEPAVTDRRSGGQRPFLGDGSQAELWRRRRRWRWRNACQPCPCIQRGGQRHALRRRELRGWHGRWS